MEPLISQQPPAESTTPAPETVIFTMRVELPLDGQRTGINRMVHACADVIMHLGDNGLALQRKLYLRDPAGDSTVGEWAIDPAADPAGTATYAFTAREIAQILHALRIVQEIRDAAKDMRNPVILKGCYHEEVNAMTLASVENNCEHFEAPPLDDEEIDALCDRLNPLDAK
jgi:hypothetical protein